MGPYWAAQFAHNSLEAFTARPNPTTRAGGFTGILKVL